MTFSPSCACEEVLKYANSPAATEKDKHHVIVIGSLATIVLFPVVP